MLRLHPDKRAKASDLIHHNWLEGVLVQGEIDVIRRLEMDEAVRRRGLEMEQQQQQSSSSGELSRCLDQSERDAMKPVDESVIIVNGQEDEEDEDEDEVSNRPRHHPPILGAPPVPMVMASGIARALQSNANMSPPKQASGSAGSKKRT